MKDSKMILQLSNYEIWYLLTLFAPATVIGFRNPTTGMLTEDMFPIVQAASFSLYDKDLIAVDDSSQIIMKEPLASVIHAIAFSQATILLASRTPEHSRETVKSFHFSEGRVVLLEELDEGNYGIQEIEDRNEILPLMSNQFIDAIFWAPDSGNLSFAQSELLSMQQSLEAGQLEDAKTQLDRGKGDERSKLDFWTTVQAPLLRYSVVGFLNKNNVQRSEVSGFSVIAGEQYVWLLETMDDENAARVSKVSLKDLRKKIDSLVSLAM